MTLRVLHVHAGTVWGGVESAIETLCRTSSELEHAIALGSDGVVAARLRPAMPVHVVPPVRLSRPWTTRESRSQLTTLVAHLQPDVCLLHSTWALAAWGHALRRARIPIAVWHHGRPPGGMLALLAGRVPVAAHVANSQWTAMGVRQRWPGVDPPVMHPPMHRTPTAPRDDTRAALGVPDGGIVMMSAARWEPGKGQDVLIDALAMLERSVPWRLWLAGGVAAARGRRLEAAARSAVTRTGLTERIRFLGHRDDVPDLLRGADLYVQPNTGPEAFGLSLVEAMAGGLPVVTSDLGAAPEVVPATCGRLVPPGDASALADTLRALVTDETLRRRLGSAGPAHAHALTDPGRIATALTALLRSARDATLPAG